MQNWLLVLPHRPRSHHWPRNKTGRPAGVRCIASLHNPVWNRKVLVMDDKRPCGTPIPPRRETLFAQLVLYQFVSAKSTMRSCMAFCVIQSGMNG